MTTEFDEPAGPARRGRHRPRHHRLGHDHPGPDQPVRRGDARQPVDPRRHRAGQGRAVRRTDRARLPHDVARRVLPAASSCGSRASRWASTTAPTRCASRRRCRSARSCGAGASCSTPRRCRAACRRPIRITIEREGGDKPAAVVDTVTRYLVRDALRSTRSRLDRQGRDRHRRRAAGIGAQTAQDLRRGGRRRRARRPHEGTARRGRRRRARLRPARARDPVRRQRQRGGRRHRRADDRRVRPHRRRRQQRGRHACRARSWTRAPGYLERVVPLQRARPRSC